MKLYLLMNSFFLFLQIIILESSLCSSNPLEKKYKTIPIIKDALIQEICPKTTNPSFCKRILTSYKGSPFIPKPITNVINNFQVHVKSTKKQIQSLYDTAKRGNKSELKVKYQLCNEKYATAVKLVQGAVEGLKSGKFGAVKVLTSNAMAQVRSCNEELPKTKEPKLLRDNNRWFGDLGSIILVICDKI